MEHMSPCQRGSRQCKEKNQHTLEPIAQLGLSHVVQQDLLQFLLRRVKLSSNPSEGNGQSHEDLNEGAKHD